MHTLRSTMVRILVPAWWLFGSTVLAGVVLRWWVGDQLFVTRYTGYVMPWLLLALVPGMAWTWMNERRLLAFTLALPAAIIVAIHAPLFRPRPRVAAPPQALVLRVMSYNTWSRNTDETRIAAVVLRQRPDVLLLQEIRPEVMHRLEGALRNLYDGFPLHRAYDPELLQGIVSRYPVESCVDFEHEGKAQRAIIRSPAGPVTVFNVHPRRSGGWRDRYSQIAALVQEHVVRETGPVILGGDFNAPDGSQLYGMVSRHLESAHAAAGFGFGFTYPARVASRFGVLPAVPLVRIDHIFFASQFVALRAGTIPESGGSDHRPVLAELALEAAQQSALTSGDVGVPVGD